MVSRHTEHSRRPVPLRRYFVSPTALSPQLHMLMGSLSNTVFWQVLLSDVLGLGHKPLMLFVMLETGSAFFHPGKDLPATIAMVVCMLVFMAVTGHFIRKKWKELDEEDAQTAVEQAAGASDSSGAALGASSAKSAEVAASPAEPVRQFEGP